MSKFNSKTPICFFAGLLLLCLTLVSTHMTSGLYARYISSADGSDSARVAEFNIDGTTKLDTIDVECTLLPGGLEVREFEFKNNGETALKYEIKLTNTTKNLPLTLTGASGTLDVGQSVSGVICTIEWDNSIEANLDPARAGMVDVITIEIIVEQVD